MVWRRSIASVTICTAVSKPKVKSVPPTSLSIVFGTPTMGRPWSACSWRVISIVCSPPIATIASSPCSATARSTSSTAPSRSGSKLEVLRIVPPRWRIPETVFMSRAM